MSITIAGVGVELEVDVAESICPTEDLANDDAATRFSGENQANEHEDNGQGSIGKDLDALLQDYFKEQESSPSPETTCKNKCQSWLDKVSTSTEVLPSGSNIKAKDDQAGQLPPEAIEKIAALLKNQLVTTRTYQTYGSDCESDFDRKVPVSPIRKLTSDIMTNLPEALMGILSWIGATSNQNSNENSYGTDKQMKNFTLEVLRHLVMTDDDGGDGVPNYQEKITKPDVHKSSAESISIESREKYFSAFKIKLQSTRLSKSICEEVELYINIQIQNSKTSNKPWICISNAAIFSVISETNQEKGLYLDPEKLAKYANHLQKYVWDNIINRCLALLKDCGFDTQKKRTLTPDNNIELSGETFLLSQDILGSETLSQPLHDAIAIAEALAVNENADNELESLGEQNAEELNDFVSVSSNSQVDSELEFLRDSQSSAVSSNFNMSPAFSLPSRSPDVFENVCVSPRQLQLNDSFINETMGFRGFGNSSSQESSNSDESFGPTRKFRRLI